MLTQPTFGPRAAALNIQFNDTPLLLRRRGLKLAHGRNNRACERASEYPRSGVILL